MAVLKKIGRLSSLTDQAYCTLKEAIINNEIQANVILVEEQLALELGVSRTTIRAALQRLTYEKLVEVIPGKGTMVAKLDIKDTEALFVVRQQLEALAIELAIINMKDTDIDIIEDLINEMEKQFEGKNYLTVVEKNIEFHSYIAEITENRWLYEMLSNIYTHVQRIFILDHNMDKRGDSIIKEHRNLLQALKTKNKQVALDEIKTHIKWRDKSF